jgi:antitoxin component of RelBE/YafQ-DinJ toxin-antitoxin module
MAMRKFVQLTIRMDSELHKKAMDKCKNEFDMCLGTLVKLFLKSFISQKGIGFHIGDEEFYKKLNSWLSKKQFEKYRGVHYPFLGPTLGELYDA